MLSADVLRALAHELLDVSALSAVLALAVFVGARIGGIEAGARSRWWSAVAVVPVFALVCALVQPLLFTGSVQPAAAYAGRISMLVDPLDNLLRAGASATTLPAIGAARTHAAASAPVRRSIPGSRSRSRCGSRSLRTGSPACCARLGLPIAWR